MLKFWRNPEFVRHLRSELRPTRAVTVAGVVLLICVLIGLACWSEQESELRMAQSYAAWAAKNAQGVTQKSPEEWAKRAEYLKENLLRLTWLLFCRWLLGIQAALIPLWSLFMCAQSVSGEREHKTWDFQRTTSLTSAELAIGKVLGEPVLAYFAMLCALPATVAASLIAGFTGWNVLNAYIGLIACSLFMGVCGLWLSLLIENRSRSVGLIASLGLYGLALGAYGLAASWFRGLAGFSPFTNLYRILDARFDGWEYVAPMLFGHAVPWLLMSLLLYLSFGAWLVLMIVRSLKRDYNEIRLLSRWQAVGCAAFLNFVFYALFSTHERSLNSDALASLMVALNGAILFAIGLASLTPPERLKVWWRDRHEDSVRLFSEPGLPWPWLVASAAVAYGLLVWGLFTWRLALDFHISSLRLAALRTLVVLVFVTRDILFIQWCTLTRLRQPVLKGILFLCLYYAGCGVVAAISGISGQSASMAALNLLTPIGVFDPRYEWGHFSTTLYGGLALQAGLIAMVLMAIGQRLGRPSLVAAVSEG